MRLNTEVEAGLLENTATKTSLENKHLGNGDYFAINATSLLPSIGNLRTFARKFSNIDFF